MKDLSISELLDYYEALLTKRQRELLRLYYDEDLSLAEIGEAFSISRQAAQNSIHLSVNKLHELETHLRLRERFLQTQMAITEIESGKKNAAIRRLTEIWEIAGDRDGI